MVHVPILKIDIPEPRLQDIIPATIHQIIRALTAIVDKLDDLINPLSPENQEIYQDACIRSLPREFRKARKNIAKRKITDPEKLSEELEDAAFAFYRRAIRLNVAGYSDEETEDFTFRKLIDPVSATKEVDEEYADRLEEEALKLGLPWPPEQEEAAEICPPETAAASTSAPYPTSVPSRATRVVVTTAAGGAGLAVGQCEQRLWQLILYSDIWS